MVLLGRAVEREGGAGQTCSTHEGKENCTEDFGGTPEEKRDYTEELIVDVRVILKWILKK